MARRDHTGWLGREDSNLRMAESKSALLNLSFDGLSDMRSPKIECFFPFLKEFMPLVDGRYARNRTRLMVEDLVSDMRGNAQPCHSRNNRAS